jgi:hypothetical protein
MARIPFWDLHVNLFFKGGVQECIREVKLAYFIVVAVGKREK